MTSLLRADGRLGGRFRYQQLARQFAREVRTHFQPGERFPSEPDLCARFGVTRNTVRKAIDLLAADGLLERRGRAGNYVADYHQSSYDDRLFCVSMPIRNHLWDQLFLSLSHHSIAHERYALICDVTGINAANPFAEVLPPAQQAERLSKTLAFRPYTLVLHREDVLHLLGPEPPAWRNLILLSGAPPPGYAHAASVTPDYPAAWRLAAAHARQVGCTRLILFLPPGNTNLAQLQHHLTTADAGGFSLAEQAVVFEHHPDWQARMVAAARTAPGPAAVLCSYDWGAHLALQVLRTAGLDVPTQVGVYGMNNTPWSIYDNLTSVYHDPDAWAAAVFDADDALNTGQTGLDLRVPPTLMHRGSTLPGTPPRTP
jgi:DNA-binding transcriptional regulator YhcF (GntR family)